MKSFLLLLFIFISAGLYAQTGSVNTLPAGTYETFFFNTSKLNKWTRGDIILLDEKLYKIGSDGETGEYRFSATAQRVFFITGPLKGVYAKTEVSKNSPSIVLPVSENKKLGYDLVAADVYGYYKSKN